VAASENVVEASVVIPVYGPLDDLRSCLDALATQRFPRDRFEIVVVDNGPFDDDDFGSRLEQLTKLVADIPHAQVHQQREPGSYAARNLGLAVATGDILAFTDADCLPEPTWLEAGVDYLRQHRDIDAAAGAIDIFARDNRCRTGAELYELLLGFQQEKYVTTAGFGATANVFARRSAFDKIGAFDDSLRSGGDKDWGYRLPQAGGRMGYTADAVVRHPARRTLRELWAKVSRVADGDIVLRRRRGWSLLNWLIYSLKPIQPPLRAIWRSRHDPRLQSYAELWRYGGTFVVVRWITTACRIRRVPRWPSASTR
jgi:GT2 family glycosyltransferase